jgi:hypothetical protein
VIIERISTSSVSRLASVDALHAGRNAPASAPEIPDRERVAWGAAPTPTPVQAAAPVSTAATAVAEKAGASDALTLARLAQDVYLDVASPPSGYRVASEAELALLGVTPAMLATQPNGYRARAYVTGSGDTARVVIAFRGSSEAGDWAANARQAVGANSFHYARALDIGRMVAASGASNVVFTGHSLGGGLASAAALAAGRPAASFNAAGLHDATIDRAEAIRGAAGRGAPDIRAYHVRGEVLSALQDGGDRIAGGLLGRMILGPLGGVLGSRVDAPEAYGTRIALDAVRPEGKRFWNDNPVDRHGMDWVIAGLQAR